jgi:two-component system response regulator DesR
MGTIVVMAGETMLLLDAIGAAIDRLTDFEVVGIANGNTKATWGDGIEPTLVILELRPPPQGRLGVIAEVAERFPGARIMVVVNGRADRAVAAEAVTFGASAVVRADATLTDLIELLHTEVSGHEPPRSVTGGPAKLPVLTAREVEVLRFAHGGLSFAEIAERLCLAVGTVRNVASSAMKKLGCRNRFQAAITASRRGLL